MLSDPIKEAIVLHNEVVLRKLRKSRVWVAGKEIIVPEFYAIGKK